MLFIRSMLASAGFFSSSATYKGWALHRKVDEYTEVKKITTDGDQASWSWKNVFRRRRGDVILDCPKNQSVDLLSNNLDNSINHFYNFWLNISPATVVSEVTPTVLFHLRLSSLSFQAVQVSGDASTATFTSIAAFNSTGSNRILISSYH